jgi:hypothetical protein
MVESEKNGMTCHSYMHAAGHFLALPCFPKGLCPYVMIFILLKDFLCL